MFIWPQCCDALAHVSNSTPHEKELSKRKGRRQPSQTGHVFQPCEIIGDHYDLNKLTIIGFILKVQVFLNTDLPAYIYIYIYIYIMSNLCRIEPNCQCLIIRRTGSRWACQTLLNVRAGGDEDCVQPCGAPYKVDGPNPTMGMSFLSTRIPFFDTLKHI